jgi:hypothetical protein
MRRIAAAALVLAALATSCGGDGVQDGPSVEGIVVAVDGDLTEVRNFTVIDEAGTTLVFTPAPGLTFHDGPLSHLSAHITSGEPIVVTYEEGGDGLVAIHVDDA